jgi:hypothetical protein
LIGEDAESIQPLLDQFIDFSIRHWWLALLSLAFVSVASILFSHLIFGPMRRFENALKLKKEFPDLPVFCKLRKGDYFHDFSHLFDEVVNRLGTTDTPLEGRDEQVPETGEIHPAPSDPEGAPEPAGH